ncbi:nucleotide exchange factor GrpE [Mycobacterium sp.]|uniref:nucleotide exchange factor GrpE n=1 Tax=Mycobacterium sp. TaxID=1785 RepID=UPI003BAEF05D
MISVLSGFHFDAPYVGHPHPGLAAEGFAPQIDWIPTLGLLALLAAVVFVAGAALGMTIRRPRTHVVAEPSASGGARPTDQAQLRVLAAQRGALVNGCVKVRGLLDDQLLTGELDSALRDGGVTVFDDVGQLMDPVRHRVNGTVGAPDASAEGVVAQTVAPGYLDHGRVLRPADVLVYKWSR